MSNTVITNYTDLNGPSSKADSSVVVIVNKDGSLSVDQNLLGTLMGTDGSQSAGISVVRVGHEGKPEDATDSESEDDKIPHVTLTVDSYYNEPNSIIKYDSGAEMLQSLRIETRENSLVGFQNDHCYTPLTSPSQVLPQRSENFATYDEPVIEISHNPPPKPVPSSKKITILEQQIIPKGKKINMNSIESPVNIKSNAVLSKTLPVMTKSKEIKEIEKESKEAQQNSDDSAESRSSSEESIPDRDSDSDYKDRREPVSAKSKKPKAKARILQPAMLSKSRRADSKISRLKLKQHMLKKEIKDNKNQPSVSDQPKLSEKNDSEVDLETLLPTSKIAVNNPPAPEFNKVVVKQGTKSAKKEKKAPSHPALLTDMTALFSTPDVIRRISTDTKTPGKNEKESLPNEKKPSVNPKSQESNEGKAPDNSRLPGSLQQTRLSLIKTNDGIKKEKIINPIEKSSKGYDLIPQLDDASLAQILQDTTGISSNTVKSQPINTTPTSMASPGLAGPLSPTLDLLGGLPPEEDLTEDLLMHVAQLVESSENLQEVIDKQVLGKVDSVPIKTSVQSLFQQAHASSLYTQTLSKTVPKNVQPRKEPIEIVRRDGRVITLPPIEAPATRSSKRKSQMTNESPVITTEVSPPIVTPPIPPTPVTPEPQILQSSISRQYVNKKLANKKLEAQVLQPPVIEKVSAESQESWNSEDDPNRLWCICRQPHNNRFMICCDGCEDWFHGKCVNITKAMGQQMEEQGIEWRCPNCIKKTKTSTPKSATKGVTQKRHELLEMPAEMPRTPTTGASKTGCIVCKKPARASSIYCSDACILKHAQDSLGNQGTPARSEAESGNSQDKQKSDSRVIVYERKSGRLLAGPNAPTAENLKSWLQKNPTFEVVRPGALSTIRPGTSKKKFTSDSTKIQTTLNFERIPRQSKEQGIPAHSQHSEIKESRLRRALPSPKQEKPPTPQTPVTPKSHSFQLAETPKASTSTAKPVSEPRKLIRSALNRSQTNEKPSPSPSTSRRKDSTASENKNKMNAPEVDIRENVRKSLQEQMSLRMAEKKKSKFTEEEIQQFAEETELELHELFRDTGMKYKAKYRSLMFNIKDRKNLTLWEKICDKSITPKQLVRLSPEELASQELAEWRDQESKHQLELIKKSELDLLAASKTYVLKTHKGEEVMETKEATELELDPNVPVEDVVTALNDSTVGEEVTREVLEDSKSKEDEKETKKESNSKKRQRDSSSSRSKKSRRDSKRDSDQKSRSSRRKSELKEKESREERRRSTRRAEKKARTKSLSRDRLKRESKEKSDSSERSRHRSRSKDRLKRESKEKSDSSERSRHISRSRDRLKRESKEKSDSSERSRHTSRSRDRLKRESKEKSESSERSRHGSQSKEISKRRSKSREYSRSTSKGRERSRSRARSRRRSDSRDTSRRRRRSRSKHARSDEILIHRSRSQENYTKIKTDSTDSDSIERPKSAMQKEPHPEYDPHEPMITSAFSEEDLRKPDDAYEDNYKSEIVDTGVEYDPTKSFTLDTSDILPSTTFTAHQDKPSEVESDQEPSSTVENAAATVWNGCINMVDVARFYVAAHEVSGSALDLEEDLSTELDIVGRIKPETVWDYINKTKKASNKDIIILRLQAANDEEKMQYIALFSYLSSRNRLGVVKVPNTTTIKDFYIIPLPANTSLQPVLLPLEGPGLGDVKTHLLIAVVIRQRKKRLPHHIPNDLIPAKVSRVSRKRSYTPPVGKTYTPPASPRRRAVPQPAYTSSALSSSVKDKIAASLACADVDEAYSPGSSNSSGGPPAPAVIAPPDSSLRNKMEELNRQIEEQKQQILKMAQADSSMGGEDDEAYSPSRPMTPPKAVPSTLADISLPSNLQEILATIKQRSENASADVDMRNLPLP